MFNTDKDYRIKAEAAAQIRGDIGHAVDACATSCGQGYSPSESLKGGPFRVPIRERLARDASKAGEDAQQRFSLLARLDSAPGTAEFLDILQAAIDLGYITPRW